MQSRLRQCGCRARISHDIQTIGTAVSGRQAPWLLAVQEMWLHPEFSLLEANRAYASMSHLVLSNSKRWAVVNSRLHSAQGQALGSAWTQGFGVPAGLKNQHEQP
jgi:hypothetical protein